MMSSKLKVCNTTVSVKIIFYLKHASHISIRSARPSSGDLSEMGIPSKMNFLPIVFRIRYRSSAYQSISLQIAFFGNFFSKTFLRHQKFAMHYQILMVHPSLCVQFLLETMPTRPKSQDRIRCLRLAHLLFVYIYFSLYKTAKQNLGYIQILSLYFQYLPIQTYIFFKYFVQGRNLTF